MLKNNEVLFNLKEDIKKKYGYDEEFAETIALVSENVIDHFGEEYTDTIYNAVLNCKYVVAPGNHVDKSGKRVSSIKSLGEVMEQEGITGFNSLNGEVSAYVSMPQISYNGGEYTIDSVKRVIGLPSTFNSSNPRSLGMMTRETCKLVKSFNGEYTISGDRMVQRSGISTSEYVLSQNSGSVSKRQVSSRGYGLETGLNFYDELAITRKYIDSDYETYGSPYAQNVAGYLKDHLALDHFIREAEMNGNAADLRNILDQNMPVGYEGLVSSMDTLVDLETERAKSVHDDAKQREVQARLDAFYKNSIAKEISALEVNIQSYLQSMEESKTKVI